MILFFNIVPLIMEFTVGKKGVLTFTSGKGCTLVWVKNPKDRRLFMPLARTSKEER
jgi:hypothetical protein